MNRAHNFHDIRGQRFGRVVVLADEPERIGNHMLFRTQCDCGSPARMQRSGNLVTGKIASCGCVRIAKARARKLTHGQSGTGAYISWGSMLQRCTNPTNSSYKEYGAVGIVVCARWRNFDAFFADMGPRPKGDYSIDRFPNREGNYEPGNCRWATDTEQAHNRRLRFDANMLTLGDETLHAAEWARRVGIDAAVIRSRVRRGWPVARALAEPVARMVAA